MDQTRWQQVTALFDEAMELPAAERDAFVRAKADGDADLGPGGSLAAGGEEAGPGEVVDDRPGDRKRDDGDPAL